MCVQLVLRLTPGSFAAAVNELLASASIQALSLDDIENVYHGRITRATGATVYFTNPYSS